MTVEPQNANTEVEKVYLPGDHGAVGGGMGEYRGLSDNAAIRAIELLRNQIAFDPIKVSSTFKPDIHDAPVTSKEFHKKSIKALRYSVANLFRGAVLRPPPTADPYNRDYVNIDSSIFARFIKHGILPESMENYRELFEELGQTDAPLTAYDRLLQEEDPLQAVALMPQPRAEETAPA